ncbi:hypothetical protein HGRIS_014973 [Hohenbuehelia grisea]|uniref:Uncharacterized protein n=1 Tax=Hohenbuehelia grisea TaxID=104357 RepID=A0ABR3ISK8_9AGAR
MMPPARAASHQHQDHPLPSALLLVYASRWHASCSLRHAICVNGFSSPISTSVLLLVRFFSDTRCPVRLLVRVYGSTTRIPTALCATRPVRSESALDAMCTTLRSLNNTSTTILPNPALLVCTGI